MADDERTPDSTEQPAPAEDAEQASPEQESSTTEGWTPLAVPGKPDGEVDTRAR